MKLFKFIIIGILIFLVVIYLGLSVFLLTKGKMILSKSLNQLIGKDVNIDSLYLTPPFSININNLEIKDLFTVEKIKLQPSILGLFLGRIGLNKLVIVKLEVRIVRIGETQFNINEIVDNIKQNQAKGGLKLSFIKEAVIKTARLSFEDKITTVSFDIRPIEVSVITSLKDFKTRFNLDAQAVSGDGERLALAKAEGWLNFLKKDMDAKFSLDELEVTYFSPYFKKFLRRVESGKLLFIADMFSKDNDLTIDCHLETHNLKFSEESLVVDTEDKKITLFSNLSGIVLDTLIGPGSGGIFDFSIHTNFDNPKLEGLQFKGNIFKELIKNTMENPQETIEKFKKAGEDFEKVGKELKEQFKGIEDIFKGLGKDEESDTSESQSSSP